MLEALIWGLVAGSSLLIGAYIALRFNLKRGVLGLVMAFASGVLIAAVAYELVLEAVQNYSAAGAGLGIFVGAGVFYIGDALIDKQGGNRRKSSNGPSPGAPALAIVLGIVLDGVPESAVLGLTLIEGDVGLTMLIAVFLSNLPESLAATTGLKREGWSTTRLTWLWLAVFGVSGIAAAAGYGIFGDASEATVAFVLAFAGGAILTMLADTMMPEAFKESGAVVGVVTTFGFALAFGIQALE
jgi:ZIP family zinc transporter